MKHKAELEELGFKVRNWKVNETLGFHLVLDNTKEIITVSQTWDVDVYFYARSSYAEFPGCKTIEDIKTLIKLLTP